MNWRTAAIATVAVWLLATSLAGQAADDSDVRFVEGLRQRRLYDLAVTCCRTKLANPEIDSQTQSTLTLEWIKTLAAQAAVTPGPSRASLWAAADQVATDFVNNHPQHPRRILVEVQRALSVLAHGRVIRQEIEAEIQPATMRNQSLERLRTANSLLGQVEREIEKKLPEQRGRNVADDELNSDQLMALRNNVRYQQAVCNLNRAQLFPVEDRLNRVDALNQVLTSLDEVLRESDVDQPIWWNAKLAQAATKRLLGNLADAQMILADLPVDETDESNRQEVLEQKIQVAIDIGDKNLGRPLLAEAQQLTARQPSLELAIVKLMTAQARLASDPTERNRWLELAEKQTIHVAEKHGAYWGRLADLALIGPTANQPSNNHSAPATSEGEMGILVRRADQSARNGNFDDALRGYDRALQLARENDLPDQYFQIGIRAAKIEEQQQRHESAAGRFLKLADDYPQSRLAPATHLRGSWNLAQSINQHPDRSQALADQFLNRLKNHVSTWPNHDSTDQANMWLAAQLQTRRQWREASKAYLDVNPGPFLETATRQAAICFEQHLLEQQRQGNPTESEARPFVATLQKKLAPFDAAGRWTAGPQQLAISIARIGLCFDSEDADPILDHLKQAAAGESEELRQRAATWMVVGIACSDRTRSGNDLETWYPRVSADAEQARLCARSLERAVEVRAANRDAINSLRLRLANNCLANPDFTSDEIFWTAARAGALSQLGRFSEAIDSLKKLATQQPDSAAAQLELARTLTKVKSEEAQSEALSRWRRIAARSKPKTERWFEAKYHVALLLERSGNAAEALKLLEYLKAVPPGWENSSWKSQFQALLVKCQN